MNHRRFFSWYFSRVAAVIYISGKQLFSFLEVNVLVSVDHRHGVGGPVVGEVDGEYHYDHKHSVLEWQLPVVDSSNKSGSMEFSIAGHPGDFFPVSVSFSSTKSYCNLKVTKTTCK